METSNKPENIDRFYKKKLIEPSRLKEAVAEMKKQGKRIATLNGSFDLLHAGHLHIIYEASKAADLLIVALNSDSSIKAYKGESKPYVALEERLKMMAALGFVDYVTWFDETTPIKLLEIIKPDVHVNGSEYGENCIEAGTVRAGGGTIKIVELVPGLSTSALVKKIIAANGCQQDAPCG